MKIDNLGLKIGQKSVNPFKTSRNSTTNPFQNVSFEGNTLECADVFEKFKPKSSSKFKMISASVVGSMNKLRSKFTEPIVNFVNRVRENVSSAWDYANNTNISDIAGIKNISEAWNNTMNRDVLDIGKDISNSISGIGKNISEKMSFLNTDILDLGKGISDRWSNLISKIHHNKISKDMSVEDLKALWLNEINSAAEREVA